MYFGKFSLDQCLNLFYSSYQYSKKTYHFSITSNFKKVHKKKQSDIMYFLAEEHNTNYVVV